MLMWVHGAFGVSKFCDVAGGAHATVLWKKRVRHQAPNQYGYCVMRQNLLGVLAFCVQMRSLRSQRCHGVAVFFDATNAFPSMSWDALDEATGLQVDRDDGVLLWTRFHRAACVVNGTDGCSVVLRARQGDRQGDGPAAQRFTLAYNPTLVAWCLQTMNDDDLNVASRRDRWSESWRPPMHVQMVDHTARTVTARTPEFLVQRVCKLVATLGEATAPLLYWAE